MHSARKLLRGWDSRDISIRRVLMSRRLREMGRFRASNTLARPPADAQLAKAPRRARRPQHERHPGAYLTAAHPPRPPWRVIHATGAAAEGTATATAAATATATARDYLPGTAPNSSVDPNPSSAPASAVPLARASAATAAATADATSRLNTDGMM